MGCGAFGQTSSIRVVLGKNGHYDDLPEQIRQLTAHAVGRWFSNESLLKPRNGGNPSGDDWPPLADEGPIHDPGRGATSGRSDCTLSLCFSVCIFCGFCVGQLATAGRSRTASPWRLEPPAPSPFFAPLTHRWSGVREFRRRPHHMVVRGPPFSTPPRPTPGQGSAIFDAALITWWSGVRDCRRRPDAHLVRGPIPSSRHCGCGRQPSGLRWARPLDRRSPPPYIVLVAELTSS